MPHDTDDLLLDTSDELLPDPMVAKGRYKVVTRTLYRWDRQPDLGFPPAVVINGRKYRFRKKLDAWDAAMAAKSRAAVA
jgi:hypothetical protein